MSYRSEPNPLDFRITNEVMDVIHRRNSNVARRRYLMQCQSKKAQKVMEENESYIQYMQRAEDMKEHDANYIQHMEEKYGG
jgi:hypothetical protein